MRLLVAVLALCVSLDASAWWNDQWTQRKEITVDTTTAGANLQGAVDEVPVLVRLSAGNFPQFLTLLDNGADFRFVAGDDKTPLKFHVERFDPVAEMAYVWVKLPTVGPQSDQGKFYLYFGNSSAPAAEDTGGTFDTGTVAAFHFGEASGTPVDSTAYATPVSAGQVIPVAASLIGTGATLSGTEPLVIGPAPQLQVSPETGWTFETWVRLNGVPAAPAYLMDLKGDGGGRLSLVVRESGALAASLNGAEVAAATPLAAATWYHVALVLRADGLELFIDGASAGKLAAAPVAIAGAVHVGGSADGGGLLAADLDELRISSVARSADWIAFAARVQGMANDRVLRYSVDTSSDGGGTTGSFGIIFQNVFGKPEAWVEQSVIIVCGLMMLAAAAIMFMRGLALSRAAKASRQFLIAYGELGQKEGDDDLRSLYGARKQFGDSPLWRVYHVGVDEIQKRVSPSVGAAAAGIDAKSMASIKAAMDAAMVREGQRLNSQLVLLTIAISGGPFIGLFGTVVGVMVTFAAIAATGDVNIAAIAPGMAAALLATVAGLGVAIPSLFGYNWLSSRAKDQVADMRVFADELLARFDEQYGA